MTRPAKIQAAYNNANLPRHALLKIGAQCMEILEDPAGIICYRFVIVPKGEPVRVVSVLLYATPDWWDVYQPVTSDQSIDGTLKAIRELVRSEEPSIHG